MAEQQQLDSDNEPPEPYASEGAASADLMDHPWFAPPEAPLPAWPPRRAGTARFRRAFFPEATERDWNDWRWQLAHRVTRLADLERFLVLTEEERAVLVEHRKALPLAITPYYLSLLDPNDPLQPLRRSMVPTTAELVVSPDEPADPLGEDADSPVPGLVHRYPDRVLFLVTSTCSAYCRYCTRSRLVGHGKVEGARRARWEAAIAYIREHREVRDVLLSGGDPLTLSDEDLDWLLRQVRAIPHVEMIRIGTKVPAVLPQRVTPGLVKVLRRHHPLWMSLHFTHPDELTPETARACARLADAGIPLGSQTVLMKGINDDVPVLKALFHGCLRMRVRPYYLYQCDPIPGSSHFRTPVERGLEMIRGLRGHTSGYAVPAFVIDAPGGGGKIPLLPQYVEGRDEEGVLLRNYAGRLYRYPERGGEGGGCASG